MINRLNLFFDEVIINYLRGHLPALGKAITILLFK